MAGFVHHTHNNAASANSNNMYIEAAPSSAYPALQNFDQGLPPHYAVLNGLGSVVGNGYSQPVQHQMHCNGPYSVNRTNGSGTWVQVGPNPYYMQRGTQTIHQGHVVQRGTFNGRGLGAGLYGHFSASGDIN
ncbi:hypothetical protein K1719_036932 [Acacia pycnantha]|nr:hypothetical protein K1719_036932 [Acacia pycnantha]